TRAGTVLSSRRSDRRDRATSCRRRSERAQAHDRGCVSIFSPTPEVIDAGLRGAHHAATMNSWRSIMDGIVANDINPRPRLVLARLVAAQFMYVVDTFIVNVAIPSIRADLAASTAQIESVIAIYQIAYATMVITGGRLGDTFGAKRLFLIGLVGFTLTSLACGLAPSGTWLIAARL